MMRANGNHWPITRHQTAPINAFKDHRPPKARPVSSIHAPLNSIDQSDQTVVVRVMIFKQFMVHALPFDLEWGLQATIKAYSRHTTPVLLK